MFSAILLTDKLNRMTQIEKIELLKEAVGTYKANHCDGDENEKILLDFIDEMKQALNIQNVSKKEMQKQEDIAYKKGWIDGQKRTEQPC